MMFIAGLIIGWIIGIITIVAVACVMATGDLGKIEKKKIREEDVFYGKENYEENHKR